MSMKSMMIRPPRLRRRIWRAISCAASRLTGIDRVLLVAGPVLVRAGVDVDRDQGLGLVDHDLAAAGQRHLALAGLLDLALDVEALEDRDAVVVVGDLRAGALGDQADQVLRALVVGLVVDEDAVDVLGEEVAHGALDQVGLHVEAGRGPLRLHLLRDLLPLLEEEVEVADEVAGLLALAGGADDDAHALGDRQLVDELLEALALVGVLDLAGDAAAVAVGREDEVAAGQRRGWSWCAGPWCRSAPWSPG